MKNILSLCRVPLAVVSVALVLSACIPDSRHPLSDPADGQGDDRLIGRWFFVGEREKGYVDVSPAGSGRYHARVRNGPDASSHETETDILPTRIDGQLFMTVTGFGPPEGGKPEGAPHLIVRYDITGEGYWLIYWMDRKALAEDIRDGLVVGEVEPSDLWGETVRLTADSQALSAYLMAADLKRIFVSEPVGLRRQ